MHLPITQSGRSRTSKRGINDHKHRASFEVSNDDDVIDPVDNNMILDAQNPTHHVYGRYPSNCNITDSQAERQPPTNLSNYKSSKSTALSNSFGRPTQHVRSMSVGRLPPQLTGRIFEGPGTPREYHGSVDGALSNEQPHSNPASIFGTARILTLDTMVHVLRRPNSFQRQPTPHPVKSRQSMIPRRISQRRRATPSLISVSETRNDRPLPFMQSQTSDEPAQPRPRNRYTSARRRHNNRTDNIRNEESTSSDEPSQQRPTHGPSGIPRRRTNRTDNIESWTSTSSDELPQWRSNKKHSAIPRRETNQADNIQSAGLTLSDEILQRSPDCGYGTASQRQRNMKIDNMESEASTSSDEPLRFLTPRLTAARQRRKNRIDNIVTTSTSSPPQPSASSSSISRRESNRTTNIQASTSTSASSSPQRSASTKILGLQPSAERKLQHQFRTSPQRKEKAQTCILDSHIDKIFTAIPASPLDQLAHSPQSSLTSLGNSQGPTKLSSQNLPIPTIQSVEARKSVSITEVKRGLEYGRWDFCKGKGGMFVRGNSVKVKVEDERKGKRGKKNGAKEGKMGCKRFIGRLKKGFEKLKVRCSLGSGFQGDFEWDP